MSRNNDDTTINLFGFAYFENNYRLIPIDLSKQILHQRKETLIQASIYCMSVQMYR